MWNLVLISGDQKTHEEIRNLLPKGVSLEELATLDELPRPLTPSAEGKFTDTVILVDLASEPVPAGRLESFRLAGIPLVALLDSPAQREAAFRSGFDEYLLRPFSQPEWISRLSRLARLPAGRNPSAAFELERQAAVGRLTSYFCHAVNNSMQTIRGSVDLAREETDVSASVAEYLELCRRETIVIGAKINRLRQIYRPQPNPPEPVALEKLLHESLQMAADDLIRNGVTAREQFEPGLPAIHSSADRLVLAFLMMIFHLNQELGIRGGGELQARAGREGGFLQVTLHAIPGAPGAGGTAAVSGPLPAGLEPAHALIQSERGQWQAFDRENGFCLQVRFPSGGGA